MQACYDLTDPDVLQREVKALIEAGKELNVTRLTALTWNEKRKIEKDGMTVYLKPLWEWLLKTVKD